MMPPALSGPKLARWIRELIKEGKYYAVYKNKVWERLRREVLEDAHFECEDCMKNGRYRRATVVHHDQEVKIRPDLAYSKTWRDAEGVEHKNLWALCDECHEKRHKRFVPGNQTKPKKEPLTVERW